MVDVRDDTSSRLGPDVEQEFTFMGCYKFGYGSEEIWRFLQSLPRKKKKRIKRLLQKGYTMNVTFG